MMGETLICPLKNKINSLSNCSAGFYSPGFKKNESWDRTCEHFRDFRAMQFFFVFVFTGMLCKMCAIGGEGEIEYSREKFIPTVCSMQIYLHVCFYFI